MTTAPPDTRPRPRLHTSTKWLLGVIVLGMTMTVSTRVLGGIDLLPADAVPTSLLLFGLVLGAVLVVGNIIVTEAWTYMAERTGDRQVLRFAARAVTWADVFFTAPGIFLAVISGLFLTEQLGHHDAWVRGAETSFITAGVIWFVLLVPMQNRLAVRAEQDELDEGFTTILHRWYGFGILATAITLVAVGFAVFQPQF
ncbi:DUF2269 family protein [Pseudoclavibacter chungangensis]|uniref:DUF2269 family protein n=1 Tax=Pseudoclavibacter chungangensis TaxID=587635 RepID=A0A7J5BTP5_9MICO|nr:DUF2269 family protein [Pseudoclavibacter chungangensis]KAB1656856.1 DUF2269 family protein [Pseudoclavibacter chungangensis]NYJ67320.1 putative membrane protein [Pseudoclavibacter chungangensis]